MPSSDGPPLDERSLLTVTSLGHTICHLGELVFVGVMLAVQKEFALESWQAAALAGPGYLLMGVGALPVGVLADWWGPTRVFQLYFVGMAVGGLLVAVSWALPSRRWDSGGWRLSPWPSCRWPRAST
jgi:MFS family permease